MTATTVQLYDPFPHQWELHNVVTDHIEAHPVGDPARQIIIDVNAMRQCGKTTAIGNELGRFGLELPGKESIYISPTFELSRKMLHDFNKAYGGTALIKSINKTERQVVTCADHLIRFCSSEQGDSLRGLNVSGLLVIDELAYIRRSFIDEVVAPFTDFYKAPTICISTPRTKRGLHWEYQCLGKVPNSGVRAIDWAQFDLSYLRTEEWLDRKRQQIPDRTFRTDYLGQFLDNESTVFGDLKPVILPKGMRPSSEKLNWGLDWATGASSDADNPTTDRTVLTAYNERNEQVFVKDWATVSPMEQVRQIAAILIANKAKTNRIVAEKNSIGAVYIDALRAMLTPEGLTVTEFVTTNESKRRIVEDFVVLIENKDVRMLHNDTQIAEFEFFERHTTPTGAVTYSAPTSLHDDYVIASCLALSGRNIVNQWF